MKIANIEDAASTFDDKATRGWKAKEFAQLLVPLTELETYKVDPDECVSVYLLPMSYVTHLLQLIGTAPKS